LNAESIGLAHGAPVDVGIEVGHGREHIEGVAAIRGQARVGGGGAVQIEAEILGQNFALEDVVEQALVARAHENHVVGQGIVTTPCAEVPNKEAHGVVRLLHLAVGPDGALGASQCGLVCPCGIGIGDHHVGLDALATLERDACSASRLDHNAIDLGREPQLATNSLEQADHGADNGTRAAHGRVHPKAALERCN